MSIEEQAASVASALEVALQLTRQGGVEIVSDPDLAPQEAQLPFLERRVWRRTGFFDRDPHKLSFEGIQLRKGESLVRDTGSNLEKLCHDAARV